MQSGPTKEACNDVARALQERASAPLPAHPESQPIDEGDRGPALDELLAMVSPRFNILQRVDPALPPPPGANRQSGPTPIVAAMRLSAGFRGELERWDCYWRKQPMQVSGSLPQKSVRSVRGHTSVSRYGDWFKVIRLFALARASPDRGTRGLRYIWAGIESDDDLLSQVSVAGPGRSGGALVQFWIHRNRKTLAAFLASGDLEWDVRGLA